MFTFNPKPTSRVFLFDFRPIKYENGFITEGYGLAAMPIARLLQEGSFDPDEITRMTTAYEAALELLQLKRGTDRLCGLVAAKIIEVYRTGEHDPPRICARAIKELDVPLPE